MLDKTKTDKELGIKVNKYLEEKGVQTPIHDEYLRQSDQEKISRIEISFRHIMTDLGLDLSDDSLEKTPHRVAKMFVSEVFWGLDSANFPRVMTFANKMQYSQMIIEKNISVKSACEHHFQPFVGTANVSYLPNEKVIGLSKLNRIVEYFSRRPQVQERLTEQIYHALSYVLGTKNIAVVINASHMCVSLRGVEDNNSKTSTSRMGGIFMEDEGGAKQEFFESLKL